MYVNRLAIDEMVEGKAEEWLENVTVNAIREVAIMAKDIICFEKATEELSRQMIEKQVYKLTQSICLGCVSSEQEMLALDVATNTVATEVILEGLVKKEVVVIAKHQLQLQNTLINDSKQVLGDLVDEAVQHVTEETLGYAIAQVEAKLAIDEMVEGKAEEWLENVTVNAIREVAIMAKDIICFEKATEELSRQMIEKQVYKLTQSICLGCVSSEQEMLALDVATNTVATEVILEGLVKKEVVVIAKHQLQLQNTLINDSKQVLGDLVDEAVQHVTEETLGYAIAQVEADYINEHLDLIEVHSAQKIERQRQMPPRTLGLSTQPRLLTNSANNSTEITKLLIGELFEDALRELIRTLCRNVIFTQQLSCQLEMNLPQFRHAKIHLRFDYTTTNTFFCKIPSDDIHVSPSLQHPINREGPSNNQSAQVREEEYFEHEGYHNKSIASQQSMILEQKLRDLQADIFDQHW
ncbi:hypothetical protein FGO68_gene14718 [Halteria grandinella]|uniref:Uncharacterized protein n=1 Tax=Halteria grandinella TaxID=5974 RepID=A0A8J8T5A7_HALGN|nr:hypothetical protein FGO68_gene14718 [Halteria grandinella]